jgi:hypothetical protein
MLDSGNTMPFLVRHGLIDPATTGNGEPTIRLATRRNRNLRIEGPQDLGCLIKQADDPVWGGHHTLALEAAFYEFCTRSPAPREVARLVPGFVLYDRDESVLVVELIRDAVPLWEYYRSHSDRAFPVEVGRLLGRALGTVHRSLRLSRRKLAPLLTWIPRDPPGVLTIHQPEPELLATLSPANHRMLRILQEQKGLGEALDRCRKQWRPETVIHGDIRSDNVLVRPPRSETGRRRVEIWLVDWEMVRIGDPAWDLAGVLQDFLLFWISSMPMMVDLDIGERVAQAHYPIASLRGTIRAFWHAYVKSARIPPLSADDLLARAVSFSAARLIQSVYEMLREADRLSLLSVIALQLAANLMADPEEGRSCLYGLPKGSLTA